MNTRSAHQRHAGVLTSSDYSEARDRLKHDPLVQTMAHQLTADLGGARSALEHLGVSPEGQIPWHFIRAAGAEYERRGGISDDHHIGAVAEAVVRILRQTLDGPAVIT